MCRFYTYKFKTCDHIFNFHLLRCRRVGTDWTCNNNSVIQAERRVEGYSCNVCLSPSTTSATSIWLGVARNVLSIEGAGGGTVSLETGQDARDEIGTKGVMCGGLIPSLMIGQDFFNNDDISAEQKVALLCQYIQRYVDYWKCEFREPMRYLGYWMSNKELYIDLSQRFLDPFKAVCTGLYRQEHAVFDLNGMHELQIDKLREWLQNHVTQTVEVAAKRNKEEQRIASSNLAILRLKDKQKTQILDPSDLYSEDVTVYDKGPGYRRSPRNHSTSMRGPRTPSARASLDQQKPPLTPRKRPTYVTPPELKSASDTFMGEQFDGMHIDGIPIRGIIHVDDRVR